MNTESSKAGAVVSTHDIGARPRRPSESTYGLPNHEDGIQSGKLTDDGSVATPEDDNTSLTGPGATHSNGMKGQK